MSIFRPKAVILFGSALLVAGFIYDLAFAGIPFQDPSPEVEANWRFHHEVADNIVLGGTIFVLAGCLWKGWIWAASLIKRRRAG